MLTGNMRRVSRKKSRELMENVSQIRSYRRNPSKSGLMEKTSRRSNVSSKSLLMKKERKKSTKKSADGSRKKEIFFIFVTFSIIFSIVLFV